MSAKQGISPWLDAQEPTGLYRMLCRFEKRDPESESVVLVDILPPFGVVEIAASAWEGLGEPQEIRVTLEAVDLRRAAIVQKVTHGRHCPCSACAREDWTIPRPCGMHPDGCPNFYAPIGDANSHTDPGPSS